MVLSGGVGEHRLWVQFPLTWLGKLLSPVIELSPGVIQKLLPSMARRAYGLCRDSRFETQLEGAVVKRTILVSDLSGREISNPRDAVTITVKYGDARRGVYVVDAHPDDADVKKLISAGRQQARRGRRPKAQE